MREAIAKIMNKEIKQGSFLSYQEYQALIAMYDFEIKRAGGVRISIMSGETVISKLHEQIRKLPNPQEPILRDFSNEDYLKKREELFQKTERIKSLKK